MADLFARYLAVVFEFIARAFGYRPELVPDSYVANYARVEYACHYLSNRALEFYQALGYCL